MLKKVLRIPLIVLVALVGLALFQHFYGGVPGDVPPKATFEILAHRGVHQNYQKGVYDAVTGCEAIHIYKPTHEYIDNTLESIGAAFSFGATIVETDIRKTSDNQLVIFHDGMLECRTNGTGNIIDHPAAYLQSLDIGYGYTYDDGKTFPFRGKGVGKMPTLVQVLQTFPDKKFLIDHKDGSMESAALLVDVIKSLRPEQQKLLYYWGLDDTYAYVHKEIPVVNRFFGTKSQVKDWLLSYLLTMGFRGFPEESKGLVMGIPPAYIPLVWGWPYRFLGKVAESGSKFYLLIDTEADAKAYAGLPVDGIVTENIEVVGQYFKK